MVGESILSTSTDNLFLFHLLGDDIWNITIHHLPKDDVKTVLRFHNSSFLPFLKTGVTLFIYLFIYLFIFQFSGTSSILHDHSKMTESSLAITLDSSLSAHDCMMTELIGLYALICLHDFWPYPLRPRENLPHSITLTYWVWNSWETVLALKTEGRVFNNSTSQCSP